MLCGQPLTADLIGLVEKTGRTLSRRQLSRQLCHQLNFRTPDGRLKEMACRKELAKLVREQQVRLPKRPWPIGNRKGNRKTRASSVSYPKVEGSFSELGPVELILVGKARSSLGRTWNELASHHPLGPGPLCGAQLRYLVRSRAGAWLGLIAFSSAAWALEARDQWVGWTSAARKKNLGKVVCNSRFLILPWVKVPHLASHLLSRACQRLSADWQERYGVKPVLVETFVAAPHAGKCYAAANWQKIGQTKGRGRQDTQRDRAREPKQIWLYPLHRSFRGMLKAGVPPEVVVKPRLPAADWAEEEFAGADLKDQRLNKRLLSLARAFYGQPQANVAQACQGDRAATKAAYRFFEHPQVTMDELLKPHYEATFHRCRQERTVLAVQDTTALDYHGLQETEGLGPTGTSRQAGLGLWLHSTLAFNLQGTPLGLIDAQCWAREAAQMGKRHRRKELPIAEKESIKWLKSFAAARQLQQTCPETLVVSVADRESDVFELFDQARPQAGQRQPHLLIRASRNRAVEAEEQLLWDKVGSLSSAGELDLQVPRRGTQAARVARLEVRFSQVKLRAPQRLRPLLPVELLAIEAREVQPPKGSTALHWQLLTTLPVENFEQAVQKLEWYAKRWGIEVFHRTLKSGCKIEERQLGHADRLEACLAIDVVVAWRIFHLCKLGRETPEVPCTVYFEEAEWKALVAFVTRTHPQNPPTLREATRMTASLGGFLGRKADAEPGTQTLWLGLQKLDAITDTWIAFNALYPERIKPTVSSNRTYG
jgi:hypothetical protein